MPFYPLIFAIVPDHIQLRSKLAKASEKLLFEDTWSIQNVAGMFSQIVAEPTEVSSETQVRHVSKEYDEPLSRTFSSLFFNFPHRWFFIF